MFTQRRIFVAASLLALALLFTSSAAAFVPWGNSSGTADYFDWENGGSDNGLFGDPVLVGGNTFVFFPNAFRAMASDGGTDAIGDRLVVDLIAHTDVEFQGIEIAEFGDWGITVGGSVDLNAVLSTTDLNDPDRVKSTALAGTPAFPIEGESGGDWSAEGSVDFSADFPAWTHLRFELTDDLLAISVPGGTSFIEKDVVGGAVAVTIIPEPATAALLALAGAIGLRRARH